MYGSGIFILRHLLHRAAGGEEAIQPQASFRSLWMVPISFLIFSWAQGENMLWDSRSPLSSPRQPRFLLAISFIVSPRATV